MSQTLNERLLDATLRHQIALRRYSAGQVKKILAILEKADADLAQQLQKKLVALAGKPLDLKSKRLQALLKDVKVLRDEVMVVLHDETRQSLKELSKIQIQHEQKLLSTLLPVEISVASVAAETLYAATISHPFAGGVNSARTLKQWFDSLKLADQNKLVEVIQLGLSQGQTVDDMVRRVVGTKAQKYADGILAITRRNAEAVVRTGINHVSNAARNELWKANEDIIYALKWTATLDGRTSAVCRARDGALVAVGDNVLPRGTKLLDPPGARPPAHPNCRSVMVAVLSEEGIADALGDRPFVSDIRTGKERERDFRAEAKDAIGADKWKQMDEKQRRDAIAQLKRAWARDNVGQVPSDVTYQEWLKRQSKDFQEDVLGIAKAKIFRDGKLSLDQFVDKAGRELTLEELASLHPEAFKKAGL